MQSVVSLLNFNYSKCTTQYQIDDYIRQLRTNLQTEYIRNQYLLNEEQRMYIKDLKDQSVVIQSTEKLWLDDINQPEGTPHEITATIDPSKFPALSIIPPYEQIKYFKKIFSKLIVDNVLTNLYGCFEKQKNGNIHFHGLTYIYNNNEQARNMEKLIASYLTDRPYRPHSKFKNTQCKPIRDLTKWFIYMNKESDDYIQYQLSKDQLNL